MTSLLDQPRTTVHLVRHGEVENPDKILYGRMPGFHLSALGREMAQVVAEHLAGRDLVHLVTSPLERAQETAAPLAALTGLTPVDDERAIEAGNDFEGSTVGSNPKQLVDPRHWVMLRNPIRPSWGEAYADIAQRMGRAVESARQEAEGREAVIVSHQLPIWTVRLAAEQRPLWHDPRRRQCTVCSVTSFVFSGRTLARIDYAEPAAELAARSTGSLR